MSKQTLKSYISTWTVLERFIKAQMEGLDVNFYILNESVYIMDVELSYVVNYEKKCRFINSSRMSLKSHNLTRNFPRTVYKDLMCQFCTVVFISDLLILETHQIWLAKNCIAMIR